MKTQFLLPNKYKIVGWFLLVPSFILGIILLFSGYDFDANFKIKVFAFLSENILSPTKHFQWVENGILDEILLILIIIGSLFIGFSKTKNEDEFISQIRYESLVWANYLNLGLLILATLFVYDFPFFYVLLANVFAMMLFFILRFHYMIYKLNKAANDDE